MESSLNNRIVNIHDFKKLIGNITHQSMNEESKKESSGEVSSIGNKINKLDSSSGI